MNEVQLLRCTGTDGYFVLSLDGKQSDRIFFNYSPAQVRTAMMGAFGARRWLPERFSART